MFAIDVGTTTDTGKGVFSPRLLVRAGFWLYGTLFPDLASRSLEWIFVKPIKNRDPTLPSRFSPESMAELSHNGRRLCVWSWGAGPVVLLIHGWGGRAAQYDQLISSLIISGYRVVAFDGPAHGESGGKTTDFFDFVEATKRVAMAYGQPYAIVAHSFGAPVATWLVKDELPVKRLVLLAPPLDIGRFAFFVARYLGFPSEVANRMLQRLEKRFGVSWSELSTDVVVSKLAIPLLVVHDIADRQVEWRTGQTIATAAQRGIFFRTRGLGHTKIMADDSVVKRTLRFLK